MTRNARFTAARSGGAVPAAARGFMAPCDRNQLAQRVATFGGQANFDFTVIGSRAAAGDEAKPHQPLHHARQGRSIHAGQATQIDLELAAIGRQNHQHARYISMLRQ